MRTTAVLLFTASVLALGSQAHAADAPLPDSGSADSASTDIVVTGAKDDVHAVAGTKSVLPIAETPQSISVISAADIDKLGIQNLNQGLRYVAGITPETRGAGGEVYDLFTLRGFTVPTYLDGLKEFSSSSGYAVPQIDTSRLEDIEVVKGPASALYGQAAPGGLVALNSKLPTDQPFYGAAAATYGNYGTYRFDADVGGKLTDNLAVRVYGSANGADTQQYYGSRARQTVSAALTWTIDSATTLTVLGAYSHDPKNGNYSGAPGYGTLFPDPAGTISTKYADGEPGDFWRRNQAAGTYIFKRQLGSGWSFRASGRYQYVSTDLGSVYESGVYDNAAETSFGRGSYASQESLKNWTFDNQLAGKVVTGPITHDLLFGVDYQTARSTQLVAFGSADDIDGFNPVYGTQAVPQNPYDVPGYTAGTFSTPSTYNVRQYQTGLYAQDTISWAGLRLLLSGREDWARTDSVSDGSDLSSNDRKFTGRAGLLYKFHFGLAPYISYSTSFEPQTQTLETGGIAKPSLGKQVEAGVKYQVPGTDILLTGDWFHIIQANVVTTNPLTFLATQTGKYRSEGFELEATAPLPYGFNLRAAFSHQHVRDISDADSRYVGGGLIGAGNGNLTANLDWTAKKGPLTGLNLGVGVRHVDSVYAGVFDETLAGTDYKQWWTPSYTVVDAMLHYDLGQADARMKGMTIALNTTNLFNKKYLTSCYLYPAYDAWCWFGNRRTVTATLGWKF